MIFEDSGGKRRKWAVSGAIVLTFLAAVPLIAYVLGSRLAAHFPDRRSPVVAAAATTHEDNSNTIAPAQPGLSLLSSGVSARRLPQGLSNVVFVAKDDSAGARSIDEHIDQIDVIVADWFRLPSSGCTIEESVDDASRAWASRTDVRVVARLANLSGDAWTTAEAGAMLRDPEARTCIARSIALRLRALGARGLNVDLESLAPNDAEGLVAFMGELRLALGSEQLLTIDVMPDDPAYDLARIGAIADAVILMAYDEHEETSAPGPIASPMWFTAVVDRALARLPPNRLIVGVGSYCYDWGNSLKKGGGRKVEPLNYDVAMERGAISSAHPVFRRDTGGTTFTYVVAEEDGISEDGISSSSSHEVWCGDGPAIHNQLVALRSRGLTGFALWRAGSEDPSLWATVSAKTTTTKIVDDTTLRTVRVHSGVTTHGSGQGWIMVSPPTLGHRDVTFDEDGSVREAVYRTIPTGSVFRRLGGNATKREVVLTFDDGPDVRFTPMVLDALRVLRADATFFVLGEQAMKHPDLIRRIGREGHLVGNHTFHHPAIDKIEEAVLLRELLSTERVLEGQLGSYTPLFRAPYTAAFDANEPALVASHRPAFDAGYTVVGGDVDPADWSLPGAAVIADRIVSQVESGGRIVVLHDGGGDRSQTAEALTLAIPRLREHGYAIVSLDRHLGLDRAVLAPPIDGQDKAIASGARTAAFLAHHTPSLLGTLFTVCTGLAAIRVVMLVLFAIRRQPRRRLPDDVLTKTTPMGTTEDEPLATILVPAFNEEKVLRATVRSLLASDYKRIEILVIDDGSTDNTARIARALRDEDVRVRCLRKKNGGKAEAANYGIKYARGEIIVSVDADTLIAPDAIRMLVRRFDDPRVSAVCGNVEVGNVHSALTAFQAIEYVTSQNLDRRALAVINAVNVVPGALGAWRRDVLVAAGGYATDTLVEDADLTLSVLRAGGRIEYEPKAIARTEAPETLVALWKQRFRWTYGTYQCLAKHRGALLFRGATSGTIALTNMILFQVLFPALSPIGDAVMVLALLSGNMSSVLSGYLGFLAMDLFASVVAFRLDGKPLRWLPLLLVQRFTYRPFLYLVCLRALVAAISGGRHGWRKLERTGNATLSIPSLLPMGTLAGLANPPTTIATGTVTQLVARSLPSQPPRKSAA